jgi:hypothetical protein
MRPRRRRTAMKRLVLVIVLTISAIAIVGSAAHAQHVVVGVPKNVVAKYDTIYNAIAKSYDSGGKYASTPAISWSASPPGILNVIQTSTGHSAKFEGIGVGTAIARATWQGAADSVLITVTEPRMVRGSMYTSFKFLASGLVGVFDTLRIGQPTCVYVTALDRRNGLLTGRRFTLKSSNSSVVTIGSGDSLRSPACPDTTIDPVAMATLLGVARP